MLKSNFYAFLRSSWRSKTHFEKYRRYGIHTFIVPFLVGVCIDGLQGVLGGQTPTLRLKIWNDPPLEIF